MSFKYALLAGAILLAAASGCQWRERADNLENSKNLRVGMTKEEVIAVMGDPIQDEDFTTPDVWYYYIDTKWYDGLVTEDECMPLVFEHGKLVGWGNDYYNLKRLSNQK